LRHKRALNALLGRAAETTRGLMVRNGRSSIKHAGHAETQIWKGFVGADTVPSYHAWLLRGYNVRPWNPQRGEGRTASSNPTTTFSTTAASPRLRAWRKGPSPIARGVRPSQGA